ncbi:Peptidoglycan O-acetyltransferase [compost metagenome]
MLFNSLDFAIFFPIVFIGYWLLNKNSTIQNTFLVLVSYYFYACWDWRFLFLLFFSTLVNFYFAQRIDREQNFKKKKCVLTVIICINLLLLGYFKYFNFFIENFGLTFKLFGQIFNTSSYKILLPLGISFYTFQNISYVTDVYRKHSEPSKNLLSFSLFISFFPQLISGPIERTNHLMPQITKKRVFNYELASNAMRMILLGLFEKMVIADNCAAIVNDIYNNFESHSGSTLFFGAVLYSFQIYGDFSGYTHIAIGCAALLGFTLKDNFNYPYLAKNIADFWRRWHMSFSSWLRDYIYFPLGGSKKGNLIQIRNLIIVFVISGIWHGANLTFVIYGFIHAFLYILYIYYKKWLHKKNIVFSKTTEIVTDIIAVFSTFTVLTLARVFFRSNSVEQAFHYLHLIFSDSLFQKPDISRAFIFLMFCFLFLEYLQRHRKHLLDITFVKSKFIRYFIYLILLFMILYFVGESQSFIYFQF